MIHAVEDFYRQHPGGGLPDLVTVDLIQAILGDISEELRVGFVPSLTNNLKSPPLKSMGSLFGMDWAQLAIYESHDAELDLVTSLVEECRGLDVTPDFFTSLRVSTFGNKTK